METMTRSSVESSLKKIMDYASPPLSDFNKYEALEMLESLPHTAQDTKHEQQNFYRLIYQTVRGKLDVPSDQLRSLVLHFLGDKDHEKVCNCVTMGEKHYRLRGRDGATAIAPYHRGCNSRDFPRNPEQALSCFYCGEEGHFKRWCNTQKTHLAMQEKDGTSQSAMK